MARVILWLSVSADGFFEGPDQDLTWSRVDDDLLEQFNLEFRTVDAFLEGRRTYELMAGVWPAARDDASMSATMRDFAHIWVDTPKIVYSTTLELADWNTQLRRSVDAAEVRALPGTAIVGGPDLASTFVAHGLVDELRLHVHPVAIGTGRRVFPEDRRLGLRLEETRTFANGVVLLRYAVEKA
jgi:dihydrofolate reductase